MTSDIINHIAKHQRRSVQNLQSLDVLQEDNLLCVSRVSSKEPWKTFLNTEWRLDDFEDQEWPRKSSQKLCTKLYASRLTGGDKSFMCLESLLQGVFEDLLEC